MNYLKRLSDDIADCRRGGQPTAYFGDRSDWVLAAAQTRDDDALGRSNFRTLLKRLGGESDTVVVERFSHWAVGWVDYILVDPTKRLLLRIVRDARKALDDYPILDESDYSEVEDEDCRETWTKCYDPKDRLEYLRDHCRRESLTFRETLAAVRGDWYEAANLLPCPSDLIN